MNQGSLFYKIKNIQVDRGLVISAYLGTFHFIEELNSGVRGYHSYLIDMNLGVRGSKRVIIPRPLRLREGGSDRGTGYSRE